MIAQFDINTINDLVCTACTPKHTGSLQQWAVFFLFCIVFLEITIQAAILAGHVTISIELAWAENTTMNWRFTSLVSDDAAAFSKSNC